VRPGSDAILSKAVFREPAGGDDQRDGECPEPRQRLAERRNSVPVTNGGTTDAVDELFLAAQSLPYALRRSSIERSPSPLAQRICHESKVPPLVPRMEATTRSHSRISFHSKQWQPSHVIFSACFFSSPRNLHRSICATYCAHFSSPLPQRRPWHRLSASILKTPFHPVRFCPTTTPRVAPNSLPICAYL
jgi:hypothetical protein